MLSIQPTIGWEYLNWWGGVGWLGEETWTHVWAGWHDQWKQKTKTMRGLD